MARALRINTFLRRKYYQWARPAGGVLRLEVKGISGQFAVATAGDLRVVDQTVQPKGEGRILGLLIGILRPGDIVLDIGAHIGLYTILLAKAVGERGQIIAFEPSHRNYEQLLHNVEINKLTNVRAVRKALGDFRGRAILHHGEEASEPSLVRPPTRRDLGRESVEVQEGDRLVESERLPIPRLVKVDVEGSEYAVLYGLRRTLIEPACEIVCCEVHPHLLPEGVTSTQISTLLESLGFTCTEIERHTGTFHVLGRKQRAGDLSSSCRGWMRLHGEVRGSRTDHFDKRRSGPVAG